MAEVFPIVSLPKIIPATYSRSLVVNQSQYLSVEELSVRYDTLSLSFLVYSQQPHRLIQSELPRPIPWNSTELAEAVPIISHQKIISLLTREVPAVCQSQYLSVEALSVGYDSLSLSFLVYLRQRRSLSSSDPAGGVISGCPVMILVAVSVALFPIQRGSYMSANVFFEFMKQVRVKRLNAKLS